MGYLHQNVQLVQTLAVKEDMGLACSFGGQPNADIQPLLSELVPYEVADKLSGQLSRGQRGAQ